jgi:hypothetical protein
MRLSREKINHLSHLIINGFLEDENIEIFKAKNDIRLEIVRVITEELMLEEEIDNKVRGMLSSYKRKFLEGSREWEILYQKTYEEEMNKKKR